jgi:hypothetical protein
MTARHTPPRPRFRGAYHPLLLAAVALACGPARAAPSGVALNLVPPPGVLHPIPPPPYALESAVLSTLAAALRPNTGLQDLGMNVLRADPTGRGESCTSTGGEPLRSKDARRR